MIVCDHAAIALRSISNHNCLTFHYLLINVSASSLSKPIYNYNNDAVALIIIAAHLIYQRHVLITIQSV